MMFPTVVFVTATTVLSTLSLAVPLTDIKDGLNRYVIDAMASPCSSIGGCWDLLPMEELGETMQEDLPKMNVRREAANIDPNAIIESWGENASVIDKKTRTLLQNTKQNKNRLLKKDVVMPRTWGADGMPFSILYMNPHSLRGHYASTTQEQGVAKASDVSASPVAHPNYRIAVRNGTQQRRQYSIIPQSFVSYGWGPFGK